VREAVAVAVRDPPLQGNAELRQRACAAARCAYSDVDAFAAHAVCRAQAFFDRNRKPAAFVSGCDRSCARLTTPNRSFCPRLPINKTTTQQRI
jgi:hypothetical protein